MFGVLAQLLNWCYTLWPNYLGMVLMFTLILMIVITPFTVKGMRSAAEMARLQPEIKKLQDQYKNDRIKQNEEMQALFKEHGVNPLGGCLPTLLPLPIFFIVFRLLERMNGHKSGAFASLVRVARGEVGGSGGYVAPHYLAYHDKLTQSIIHSGGQLKAFGIDMAQTALNHHSSVGKALPYYILIVVMTGCQYWQQRQINQRNPAAANANPQMKMTMQLFPIFYAFISVRIPATVVFYLLISGLFRMAQNAISYRYDPVLKRAMDPIAASSAAAPIEAKSEPKSLPARSAAAVGKSSGSTGKPTGSTGKPAGSSGRSGGRATSKGAAPARQGGFMERLRAQAAEAKAQAEQAQKGKAAAKAGGDASPPEGKAAAKAGGGASPPAKPPPRKVARSAPGSAGADAVDTPGGAGLPEPTPPPTPAAPRTPSPGNGSGRSGASPLRVTRPGGRVTPKDQSGRRPRRGQ